MDKKNLIPHQAQPVDRITTGKLSSELIELSEEMLEVAVSSHDVLPSWNMWKAEQGVCSYEEDDGW